MDAVLTFTSKLTTKKKLDLKKKKFSYATFQESQVDRPKNGVYRDNSIFNRLASSIRFQAFIFIMILLNILWIGIESSLNKSKTIATANPAFVIPEFYFFVIFNFEVGVTYFAYRRTCEALTDKRFMFDLLLILLMNFELVVVPFSGLDQLPTGDLMILRVFRILRLLRAGRIVRR